MKWLKVVTMLLLTTAMGHAGELETLLMPGKLSQVHAKYETECKQCHDRSDKARQRELCLACHKDVAQDVASKQGFHGRLPNIEKSQCSACHSDHQGRTADIVKFDRTSFDHKLTDFPLHGAHMNVTCAQCHIQGKPLRSAASQCVACHGKEDPHQGSLGKDCGTCHEESRWPTVRFDHAKTLFPLTGEHQKALCVSCHLGPRYANTPTQCASCHAADDVHRGSRGAACAECHTTSSWSTANFDHAKTGFALLGAHSQVACAGCHRSGDFKQPVSKECNGCHRADDAHAARFGPQCNTCHGNDAWKTVRFEHTRDGHFTLPSGHTELACHTCHTIGVKQAPLPKTCVGCHQADDVHKGAAGQQCETCHAGTAWKPVIEFDHDLTRFPLVGLHVVAPCSSCHVDHRFNKTSSDCLACHRDRDVHKGAMGKDCASCHSPNGWDIWEFDHAKQTHFALTGAHSKLQCATCHRKPPSEVKLATDCASCHQKNDIHLGQFGRQCQQCHSTETFRGAHRRHSSDLGGGSR